MGMSVICLLCFAASAVLLQSVSSENLNNKDSNAKRSYLDNLDQKSIGYNLIDGVSNYVDSLNLEKSLDNYGKNSYVTYNLNKKNDDSLKKNVIHKPMSFNKMYTTAGSTNSFGYTNGSPLQSETSVQTQSQSLVNTRKSKIVPKSNAYNQNKFQNFRKKVTHPTTKKYITTTPNLYHQKNNIRNIRVRKLNPNVVSQRQNYRPRAKQQVTTNEIQPGNLNEKPIQGSESTAENGDRNINEPEHAVVSQTGQSLAHAPEINHENSINEPQVGQNGQENGEEVVSTEAPVHETPANMPEEVESPEYTNEEPIMEEPNSIQSPASYEEEAAGEPENAMEMHEQETDPYQETARVLHKNNGPCKFPPGMYPYQPHMGYFPTNLPYPPQGMMSPYPYIPRPCPYPTGGLNIPYGGECPPYGYGGMPLPEYGSYPYGYGGAYPPETESTYYSYPGAGSGTSAGCSDSQPIGINNMATGQESQCASCRKNCTPNCPVRCCRTKTGRKP